MRDFRFARVLGFEIRIDASWFIIFFLVLWSFTAVVFPGRVPGLGTAAYFAMGLAGTLLFFVTLLAHELAHAVVARARGTPVDGITLFVFGGVARMRSESKSPGDEFLIAGVGPLASVIIAFAFYGMAAAGERLGISAAVTVVLAYLALLNLALAIFNLLPGFPLDGGRLFRAIVWKATGNLRRATRIATAGGQWVGFGLIGLGLLSALQGNPVGGLWFMLIGWFLRSAAVASERDQLTSVLLEGVRAAQVMTPDPLAVAPDLSLQRFFDQHVTQTRSVVFPVLDRDTPLGIITLQALRRVPRDRWTFVTVAEAMTPIAEDMVVSPDDLMSAVLARLRATPSQHVLVLDRGHFAGIITATNVSNWLDRARQIEDLR
jgi:Zn-dependent protease/CBS domain-containing protein